MSQLSYQIDMSRGIEGDLADPTWLKDTVSRVSSTDIGAGRLLVRDAAIGDKGAKLPDADFSAAPGTVIGVSMRDPSKVATAAGLNFEAGVAIPVLRRGRIYVVPVDAVTQGDQAYANFQNGDEGRFLSDADGGDAAAVPDGRWFTSAGAGEIAVLEINLPSA